MRLGDLSLQKGALAPSPRCPPTARPPRSLQYHSRFSTSCREGSASNQSASRQGGTCKAEGITSQSMPGCPPLPRSGGRALTASHSQPSEPTPLGRRALLASLSVGGLMAGVAPAHAQSAPSQDLVQVSLAASARRPGPGLAAPRAHVRCYCLHATNCAQHADGAGGAPTTHVPICAALHALACAAPRLRRPACIHRTRPIPMLTLPCSLVINTGRTQLGRPYGAVLPRSAAGCPLQQPARCKPAGG